MTALADSGLGARHRASGLRLDGIATVTLILFPLALLLSWPRIVAVWQTGIFYDTDDAVRMVQVRDWMAGQGWFDLVAHRLDPPAGTLMHWSRIVDVPLAMLIRMFGLFADAVHAERLARLAFPLALQGAMIAATAWSVRALAGGRAVLPAAILILLSGISFDQFQPGRIDHHAPQILLLMLATGTTLRSLDPGRAAWAALTGCLIAVSLAISLENLPFFAVLLAAPPLAWLVQGDRHRRTLVGFAAGLGSAAPALFVLTVSPSRYFVPAPDAFSIAHLAAIMVGVAGLAGLATFSPSLSSPASRGIAVALAGGVALATMLAIDPACLGDPYAGMDPLIKRLWLDNVVEAQPIFRLARLHPDIFTTTVCPILCGAAATLVGLWRHRRPRPGPWLVLAALVGVGFAGTFWQIRVASSLSPLALVGGAWAVAATLDLAQARHRLVYTMLPFVGLALLSSLAWAMVPVGAPAKPGASGADPESCRASAALAPLAGFPAVTVFAPIDAGAHLLAYTPMSVPAGPYHRDRHGMRMVLDALLAAPDLAQDIVASSGARLLIYCSADPLLRIIRKEARGGLAAALLDGRPPAWLTPMTLDGPTPYRAFEVSAERP
ncbi:MAG TPA: hypothetical protein VH414_08105 [Lichenihabitans sp.]|jgi:hypothetical protein|nr:hypothetical protein [Lichenihabitans sp.]